MIEHDDTLLSMPSRDSLEFSAALLIGAALGLLTTRVLRPERSRKDRMRRKLRRPARRVRRSGHEVRESASETVRKSGRLGEELRGLGAEFVQAAREEIHEARRSGSGDPVREGLRAPLEALRAFRSRISRRD